MQELLYYLLQLILWDGFGQYFYFCQLPLVVFSEIYLNNFRSSILLIGVADHLAVDKILYADVIRITLGLKWAFYLDIAIVLQLVGICIAYLIFLAESVTQSLLSIGIEFEKWQSLCMTLLIIFPLSYIKNIHFFHLTSKYGFYAAIMGFIVVFYDCSIRFSKGLYSFENAINIRSSFHYVGVAILCCEGILTILPIRDSMVNKLDFKMVAINSMITAFGISIFIALIAVPTYQSDIKPILIFNLENPYLQFISVVFYSISLLLTYPLQLFPAVQIIERMILEKQSYQEVPLQPQINEFENNQIQNNTEDSMFADTKIQIVIRTLAMMCIYLIAYYVPHLSHFLNFMGSIFGSLLQFCFPVLAHMIHFKKTSEPQPKATYTFVLIVAILAMVLGSIESLRAMM
ncbi:unnamed protein product (macronuclear) [Paramecium tetraurelia]|uniref:Amino acid transporter transmembrane domain-containing protein n=1 Tax=Paramecium tetraurelia TaxID=5888 RepID=A0DFF8_PARTE|nr:uncharacterized protein GSPATT00016588001 [Paramecium tetraurelia]CAK81775.1 unnamed protein product [Paramecium tetraurelia]|eukprot:XP_001449172.1 hypothetical protein (macronuclear) [Paramecium tetraurelia strain d4-2]